MLLKCVSERGTGSVNEDVCGSTQTRFWVLDGATPVVFPPRYSAESDARYIVDLFSRELQQQGDAPLTNVQLLKTCATKIRGQTCLPSDVLPHEQPSFALAMVHVRHMDIEVTVLGDCFVIVKECRAYRVYTDERVKVAGDETQKLIKYLNASDLPVPVAEGMLRDQLTRNRQLMNRPGGYYVGTFDGDGFDYAKTHLEKRTGVDGLLLCSDGFHKVFDLGLMDPMEIDCKSLDLAQKISLLRSREATGGKTFGKQSDDATALCLTFRGQCGP